MSEEKTYLFGNYTEKPITINVRNTRVLLQPNCANVVRGDIEDLGPFASLGIRMLPEEKQGGIADAKTKGNIMDAAPRSAEEAQAQVDAQQQEVNNSPDPEIAIDIPALRDLDYSKPLTMDMIINDKFNWNKVKSEQLRGFADENLIDLGETKNYKKILKIVKDALK